MVYKFTVLSDEVDDFVRVITIDSEATFLDFHNAILDSVNFEKNLLTTFILCSDDWEKEQEVTLVEMDSGSEYDNLVMEDTKLDELLSDEKQKLMYVFDMISERAFFMELTEIITGKSQKAAKCIENQGTPPAQQVLDEMDIVAASKVSVDENFYGDEGYDPEELDQEGFGDLSFDEGALFNDDKF